MEEEIRNSLLTTWITISVNVANGIGFDMPSLVGYTTSPDGCSVSSVTRAGKYWDLSIQDDGFSCNTLSGFTSRSCDSADEYYPKSYKCVNLVLKPPV